MEVDQHPPKSNRGVCDNNDSNMDGIGIAASELAPSIEQPVSLSGSSQRRSDRVAINVVSKVLSRTHIDVGDLVAR
jgi:hypothetical protein